MGIYGLLLYFHHYRTSYKTYFHYLKNNYKCPHLWNFYKQYKIHYNNFFFSFLNLSSLQQLDQEKPHLNPSSFTKFI